MSKQTAVEWYIEESEKMLVLFYDGLITSNDLSGKKQKLLTQAKQIEREQHEKTYFKGWHRDLGNRIEDFNQYFTETYGKEESPS